MSKGSKIIKSSILSIIAVLCLSSVSYAEISKMPVSMDLVQALTYTYNNNPALQAELEKLKISGTEVFKASAEFLPEVRASLDRGKDYQNVKIRNIPNTQIDGGVSADSIQIKQPIFNSGSSIFGLKASKKAFFSNVASFANTEQQVLLSAIQAYNNVLYTKEALDINVYNVKVLTKSLRYAEERFAVGDATKADVAEAQAHLSRGITAKVQAVGSYETAKAIYKQIIGVEPINLAMIQEIKDINTNLQDLINIASNNHPEVIAAKLGVDYKKDLLVRSKLVILPSASVSASASAQNSPNYGQNTKVYDKKVMLNIQIPIYQSGLEYMSVRKNKIDVQESKYTLQKIRDQVTEKVIEGWSNLLASKEAFKSAADTVEAATITLDNMKQEEEVGTRTILDVLEAESRLFRTKLEYNDIKYKKLLNVYILKAAIGELTAQKLKLPVKIFDANAYYDKAKKQIFGFSAE
ncbi:MAG: TolC family outer membrane protein [Rickettsiales endosymbiont of Dermacentor nuttalli]